MKKNVASQVIGAQMIDVADGSAFTGAVTVYVTGDAGTQGVGSVGSGACTHEGNGYHTYTPAQAETNYDLIAFTFTGTGAIASTVQVYTTSPQTGDCFARLGAPAGASLSADVAAMKSQTAAIETDTQDIQARIPAALTAGGNIKADALAINGETEAASRLGNSTQGIVTGVVGNASSTTNIVTSSLSPAVSVTDQLKGRIVTFLQDTTTAALRGQATDITASTDMGVLTVTLLTTAPVSGDLFVVT